ncbi:MAG: MFS transporter [Eggerthellaceae bacterium]|jgi:predicted MFS family arabinose efflux permease
MNRAAKHYENVITFCCFLFLFVNVGFPSTSFNVYQSYIVAIPGVGDVGGSMILAIRTLVSLGLMIVVDRYYLWLDVRRGVFAAICMTAVAFLIYSFADSFGLFIVAALFAGAGYGLGGMVAMTMLTNRWYQGDVGGAVGFSTVGSGVAAIVVPLVATHIIETTSLAMAFRVEALVALVIGIVVFALLRNRPSDIGAEPHRSKEQRQNTRATSSRVVVKPLSRVAYALLMAACLCVGVFSVGALTYLGVLLTSSGYDAYFAAAMLSLGGACLTIGKFLCGKLFDRISSVKASVLMLGLEALGCILACFAVTGAAALAVAASVLAGFGIAIGTVGITMWSLELSTPATRTKMIKNLQVGYALGGFVTNLFPGLLKELLGTYAVSYAIMAACALFAAFVVVRIYHRYRTHAAAAPANTAPATAE